MARPRLVRAAALTALLACGSPGREQTTDLAALLPDPGSLSGVVIVEGPREYLPDTLFEPLDGGAVVYVDYGFRRLRRSVYQIGADARASITLDVFDMGSAIGAFGIYRSSLPEGAPVQPWGAEGHRTATVAAAWKGHVYVHAEADAETAPLVALLEHLVATVCRLAPGAAELPAALRLLPPQGLIPRSERFVSRDLLGHSFLPDGMVAAYLIDGERAEVFFSDLGSDRAARLALDRLRAFYAQPVVVPGASVAIADGGFRFSQAAAGSGLWVRARRFIAGAHGNATDAQLEGLLIPLVRNLSRASSTAGAGPW